MKKRESRIYALFFTSKSLAFNAFILHKKALTDRPRVGEQANSERRKKTSHKIKDRSAKGQSFSDQRLTICNGGLRQPRRTDRHKAKYPRERDIGFARLILVVILFFLYLCLSIFSLQKEGKEAYISDENQQKERGLTHSSLRRGRHLEYAGHDRHLLPPSPRGRRTGYGQFSLLSCRYPQQLCV